MIAGLMCVLLVSGCSWFHKSQAAVEPRPEAVKVSKKDAIRVAEEFAKMEGLGGEFRISSPSRVDRVLTMGKDNHWIWQVYFAHDSQRMIKFYKKSPVMIEVNAVTGEVEHWGRR